MTLIGQTLARRYRLDSVVGTGGMATVYRAVDLKLDRIVAVKVLAPNLAADESFVARFQHEARAMARVHDPAIVAVYDVGQANGEPYIVMELVEGESLAGRLRREGSVAPNVLAPILASIASALGVLHDMGLVHRDIKPANILLPATGQAKLVDFGLVRGDATASLTVAGTALGTLGYLAPELLRGGAATPASDVYAFGVVAYEALTSRRPSWATSPGGQAAFADGPPAAPSQVAPRLGTGFDTPLLAALGPAPSRPGIRTLSDALTAAASTWGVRAIRIPPIVDRAPGLATEPTEVLSTAIPFAAARPRPTAPSRPRIVAAVVAGVLLVGAVAFLISSSGFFSGASSPSPTSQPSTPALPSVVPSSAPSLPPSLPPTLPPTAPATPTAAPTPDIQGALDSLDVFEQTLADLSGGPGGIKGKDANTLRTLAEQVRTALQAGDIAGAQDNAGQLVQQSDKVAEHLSDDDASKLTSAAQSVDDAVGAA